MAHDDDDLVVVSKPELIRATHTPCHTHTHPTTDRAQDRDHDHGCVRNRARTLMHHFIRLNYLTYLSFQCRYIPEYRVTLKQVTESESEPS